MADLGAFFSHGNDPNDLDPLVDAARGAISPPPAGDPAELENAKAQFLGKAGRITER